jgi:hypothetical protein
MTHRINVPCDGNSGTSSIDKIKDTIVFGTSGNCKFTSFGFDYAGGLPPGFSNRVPSSGGGDTISYEYDGQPIPTGGYGFHYSTGPKLGDGTGVIKNK